MYENINNELKIKITDIKFYTVCTFKDVTISDYIFILFMKQTLITQNENLTNAITN